jgi:mRNA-degrading endonuclease toxin of MazEF toxin-antitoxin module
MGAQADVKQGDVYWVWARDLAAMDVQGGEQKKSRPYVIVSRNQINRSGHHVVGVPLTSQLHLACGYRLKIPLTWQVPNPAAKHPLMDCICLTDHIRVLDVSRLEQPKMGAFSDTARGGLELALATLFDIR